MFVFDAASASVRPPLQIGTGNSCIRPEPTFYDLMSDKIDKTVYRTDHPYEQAMILGEKRLDKTKHPASNCTLGNNEHRPTDEPGLIVLSDKVQFEKVLQRQLPPDPDSIATSRDCIPFPMHSFLLVQRWMLILRRNSIDRSLRKVCVGGKPCPASKIRYERPCPFANQTPSLLVLSTVQFAFALVFRLPICPSSPRTILALGRMRSKHSLLRFCFIFGVLLLLHSSGVLIANVRFARVRG